MGTPVGGAWLLPFDLWVPGYVMSPEVSGRRPSLPPLSSTLTFPQELLLGLVLKNYFKHSAVGKENLV